MIEHSNIQDLQGNTIPNLFSLDDNLEVTPIEMYAPMADIEIKEIDALTMVKLAKAHHITYYFDNGGIPEEYHYSCSIRVEKECVNVTILLHYGCFTAYDKTCSISNDEYRNFIETLVSHNIRTIACKSGEIYIDIDKDGCGASYISVANENDMLFECEVDYKGAVANCFFNLLSPDMKSAALNPEMFIDEYNDKKGEIEIIEEIDWNNDLNILSSLNSDNDGKADYINDILIRDIQ